MARHTRVVSTTSNPSAAPGDLELVRRFANTLDVEEGTDALGSPSEAAAWLEVQGSPATVRRRDLEELRALRDVVRDLVGSRGSAHAVSAFDRVAAEHPVVVNLSSGPIAPPASSSAVGAFIARILGLVVAARIDGSWDRMKICANDACRWVYFDHSRNRSRTWCRMDLCGSQAKMRAYRSRRATRTT